MSPTSKKENQKENRNALTKQRKYPRNNYMMTHPPHTGCRKVYRIKKIKKQIWIIFQYKEDINPCFFASTAASLKHNTHAR
jgi:hypothetical protein